jgi:hypothetical protein
VLYQLRSQAASIVVQQPGPVAEFEGPTTQ